MMLMMDYLGTDLNIVFSRPQRMHPVCSAYLMDDRSNADGMPGIGTATLCPYRSPTNRHIDMPTLPAPHRRDKGAAVLRPCAPTNLLQIM